MTINSEVRAAGPFEGNDSAVTFPFTFKVFDVDEVLVVRATNSVETVLTLGTDYTVLLNPDQNSAPGGAATLSAPLAVGSRLTLTSALEYLQPLDLTNQAGFYPRVINNAFDRVTILVQQLFERLSRALVFPISDGPVGEIPGAGVRAGTVLAFDTITGNPVVGPRIADVETVVGANAAIAAVAGSIADVNTVAGNIADVNTVAGNIADVNTVAGNIADVNTVADNIVDVNTVADNLTDVSNFAGVYYGASATDPATRRDGTPLQAGDLYLNTATGSLRAYTGTAWRESVSGAVTVQNLSGDGVETEFPLSYAPESEVVTQVFISGIYQQKNTYELGGLGGDVLIFDTPPPAGVNNIEVVVSSIMPSDDKLREDLEGAGGAALVGYGAGTVADTLGELSELDQTSVKKTGATGAAKLPSGTTAQRPAVPEAGMIRDNSETGGLESYSGGQWASLQPPSTLTAVAKTFINGAPLTKFGDMTAGAGLAGLFDTRIFDAARREATSGYAGVTLTAPTVIDFVEIVSNTNGFDGSGTSNTATLSLYGKNGAAPSSATDGTLLGSTTVVDDNTQKTATIYSSSATAWGHVWIRIQTAVWVTAVEVRFFKTRPMPAAIGSGTSVNLSACDNNVALIAGGREIPQFRIPIRLLAPRVVALDFHADVIHTAETGTGAIAVGFSFAICKRSGATEAEMRTAPFTQVFNALGGGNVSENNPQHYGNKSITSAITLPAGFHEISVIGSGHTDGSTVPGILQVLSEYGQGLNGLRATVLP